MLLWPRSVSRPTRRTREVIPRIEHDDLLERNVSTLCNAPHFLEGCWEVLLQSWHINGLDVPNGLLSRRELPRLEIVLDIQADLVGSLDAILAAPLPGQTAHMNMLIVGRGPG